MTSLRVDLLPSHTSGRTRTGQVALRVPTNGPTRAMPNPSCFETTAGIKPLQMFSRHGLRRNPVSPARQTCLPPSASYLPSAVLHFDQVVRQLDEAPPTTLPAKGPCSPGLRSSMVFPSMKMKSSLRIQCYTMAAWPGKFYCCHCNTSLFCRPSGLFPSRKPPASIFATEIQLEVLLIALLLAISPNSCLVSHKRRGRYRDSKKMIFLSRLVLENVRFN